MKVKKLLEKFYDACVTKDKEKEKKFWMKILKKSLKGKNTQPLK